ncbi:MAG: DNA mismatch repair endonuclease MutL [Oscillibacter sp.]|jgi:DNA mismatch repair protein MutL|nr:DNA mismatch repair endonuclease MutL [Oscillibacter sp.]
MSQIQQLSSHVADLIAAGEVVERPASVVKELVENALDAGATAVAVEIRGGGMGLIRVTDNGCGIAPEDLPTAFLRHATSKLRTEDDLGRIGTLGFRGEALAAIAAVSRTEIETRRPGAEAGALLRLEGGVPGAVEDAGTPEGTTLRIRDLFYNTPARLKFMKKDSAETAAVSGLMQHLALSRPDVSFKFVKDGEEALHTPGDGKTESAVYAALGRDFARTLLPVEGRGGETAVSGFVTRPLSARGSRAMQTFFVNGRFIKSQLLTAAVEEAYRNRMMKGKFPGCVIFVTLPVTGVDVNVHPAKTMVKFARERDVFDAVYHTVLDALDAGEAPARERQAQETVNPRQDFFQKLDAGEYRKRLEGEEKPSAPSRRAGGGAVPAWDTERKSGVRVADAEAAAPLYRTAYTPPRQAASAPGKEEAAPAERPEGEEPRPSDAGEAPGTKRPFVPAIPDPERPAVRPPEQETLTGRTPAPWRIAGEVLNTYIICETEEGEIFLIDKHAAHERLNFNRLEAQKEPPMRQTLLLPETVRLSREDAALLLSQRPLLESLGFACEDFGGDTLLVREVPADLDPEDAAAALEEFAEKLRTGRSPEERREALLHTMACKAAVKAGMHSDSRELRVLADAVQSGEIHYCPHGRPVAVKITKYQLEKLFHRA